MQCWIECATYRPVYELKQFFISSPYRAIPYTSKGREYIIAKNLDTMDKIWKHSLLRHSKKRCLGTRKIIEEKKVPGPDGKLLTKLVMEPSYNWISYEEVDQKSTYIGRLVFQNQ